MRYALLIFLLSVAASLQAQQVDSLLNRLSLDSIPVAKTDALDSIQYSFYGKSDSLKLEYKSKFNSIDSTRNGLQAKIDSLNALQLPTDKYTHKLDSVMQQREKAVASLNEKMNDLKSKATDKINKLELSPELQSKANALTGDIQGFKLPVKDMNIPSLDLPDSPLENLDGLNTSIDSPVGKIGELDGLQGITGKAGNLSSITQAGGYQSDIQNLTQGNLQDVKQLPNALESKAGDVAGVGDLKKSAESLNPMLDAAQNPDAMKEQAVKKVKEVAVNHFAGKEQVLQQAMEKMSKLKNKYSSLNSLSEVGKKRPNEMRGKPLIERLLPGIALQIQRKGDNILVDFNPYIGYRFSGRLTSGLGWNQRYGYDTDRSTFSPGTRIYGPRIYSEFKIGKGFSPRAEAELMNTYVPPRLHSGPADPVGREWVPGVFVGLKKEYKFMRKVKGTAQIMLRVFNHENKSPYGDVLNMRVGFEFPMKKKIKKQQPQE